MRKRLFPALLAGLLLIITAAALALTSPASAAPAATITDAAQALREDPVYVDPGARDQLSVADEKALEATIQNADKPVFIAVLPATEAFPEEGLLQTLRNDTGITGVYAIRLGDGFDAGADPQVMPTRAVDNLTASVKNPATDTDASAQLNAFADRAVEQARGTAPASWSGGGGAADDTGAPVSGLITLGALVAAGGAGAFALSRRNKRRKAEEERAALDKLRVVVDEDITAYGETLERLDFHPAEPGADDTMRGDYERALDSYESAKTRMEKAEHPSDVRGVTQSLEDGRYSLAVLEARRTGTAIPARRPPCFFDPRHGPAVTDVLWTPSGGASREVPVCGADEARLSRGEDPMSRTVDVGDGNRRPYWEAGPAYGPWAGGYFGGGLLPGLLVGTMLGSMLATPAYASEYGGGDFGGGAGGEWGGGDFSGSDFDSSGFGGGGGFGDGGGFGGGDFGGGF
ncbi:hypothetical protein ACFV2I_01875 [Streptomyces microflavus]|uniref:DUF4449 domain-containing protein n=1 Tax=Streptomyces microflavus TaxID=1919 RepID=A0A7H8MU29_STRMI|nr:MULTISPECIES: hypothetical protein [Streptomyces]QKW45695.1 hypothetical protein HUT09_25860 [Streptomyces microflavus]QQZ56670.1 hypothetical protein IFE09_25940 [Streptomyces microflavus]WSR94159.1 hypothetical protein OG728_28850 [Streptomyces microflavus]WTF72072.1 hypothetical protein OH770_27110 [Streptomyces microflavus]